MRYYLVSFFIFWQTLSFAQKNNGVDLRLALEFYQKKKYEKSLSLYEDVFKRDQSKDIYLALFDNYLSLERYSDAEKLVKKQLRKDGNDPIYQVDYGFILKKTNERKKGEKVYAEAIKNLPPSTNSVLALSTSFQRRNELSQAIEALKRGKKLTGKFYGYEFELAELYYQQNDLESMIDEYLDLVDKNESYLQNVQNALNTSLYTNPKKDQLAILNEALLKRIQRNPGKIIYSELLIWHYLQQKDFKGAIVQSKSLDKRNGENGYRFINLGNDCKSNREYDLAIECFQYIIEKGPSNQNYISARILSTEVIREKITSAPYTQEDLNTMEQNYVKTLDDIGRTGATVSLQIGLAEVWAFYLNKPDEAIHLLQKALKLYQLTDENGAKCKLLLADIYLALDDIWEASLLYSQVEKDFKYETLGDEAKFKNAQIFFYTGDFAWSKAQLDVLKGSTSKLIANDAMRLSLLISDNLAFDTLGEALQMFGRAMLNYTQKQYEKAYLTLDTMERIYLAHNIIDEVYYLKYEIHLDKQDYELAAKNLETIIANYPDDILGDEALFKLAELNDAYLGNSEKAKGLYQKLFTSYPASVHVAEARNRYRRMRGDDLN